MDEARHDKCLGGEGTAGDNPADEADKDFQVEALLLSDHSNDAGGERDVRCGLRFGWGWGGHGGSRNVLHAAFVDWG